MLSNFYTYIFFAVSYEKYIPMKKWMWLETIFSYNAISIHHIKKKKDGEKTSKNIFFLSK